MRKRVFWFVSIVLLIICSLFLYPRFKSSDPIVFVEVMERYDSLENLSLPPFEATSLEGRILNSDSLQGKVTLIKFWFTRCKSCISDINALNQLKTDFSETEELQYWSFAEDSEVVLQKFIKQTPFSFEVVPSSGKYFSQFGVTLMPVLFLVDQEGVIRKIFLNKVQSHLPELRLSIAQLLPLQTDYQH